MITIKVLSSNEALIGFIDNEGNVVAHITDALHSVSPEEIGNVITAYFSRNGTNLGNILDVA